MVWTKARGGKPKNHNMKINTNTPIAALCDQLREWSSYNGKDASELLDEAADRLELLDMENTDLRMALSREKQDSNFWQQKATEAMNRIRNLEEAGDAMAKRFVWDLPVNVDWRKAKEEA